LVSFSTILSPTELIYDLSSNGIVLFGFLVYPAISTKTACLLVSNLLIM